ncbi:MAG TPA: zinc-binding dehydrogenase [Candidatus Udaeobacter sp.]|nr:zinc-binding dehydrogenase [Candidatus Udaeobacter sp.]
MKAVRIHYYGGTDQLRYEDAPEPKLGSPREAIVKLKAASLNHSDLRVRRGLSGIDLCLPHIPGSDGAGIVAEIGSQTISVKPGDSVCLYPLNGCGRCEFCITDREFMCAQAHVLGQAEDGTYAEYVRVAARNCFPIPQGLCFEEAAALPMVYVTVWRMLLTKAQLKPGEYVLILGIGGGVGSAVLQIGAQLGAHLIVTSGSDEKLARAQELGAEHGINYRKADFAKETRRLTARRGADVVVDCVGGESWVKSLEALSKGGRLVTCGATAGVHSCSDVRRIFWNHLQIFGSTLGTREEFRQVLDFMEITGTKPIIDRIFSLREAAAAQERLEKGKQFGKIVLRTDN